MDGHKLKEDQLKEEIFQKIKDFYELKHKHQEFIPGKTKVNYAGRIYDEREMIAAVDSILDFWLTLKDKDEAFCKKFSELLGVRHTLLVNSGSSGNLLAVAALRSNQFSRQLKQGDEIITPAMNFSTALNPIIQNGLTPVIIDSEVGTYNLNSNELEKAYSPKTKAIMAPHILGNPCEMDVIMDFAQDKNLIVIEDTCDALDSRYGGKLCGTFGEMGTYSFYAAHHIFMGEGGAVVTQSEELFKILKSLRDWGRVYNHDDLKLPFDERFSYKLDGKTYDSRYFFTNIGYNLKPLDLQAAIGLVQLDKLSRFTEIRKENFNKLYKALSQYGEFILPHAPKKADPSWFAFTITLDTDKFSRFDLVKFLEEKQIQTRYPFAGNISKHPAYKGFPMRIVGGLEQSNRIMDNSFFVGLFPGINAAMLDYVVEKFHEFMALHSRK